MALLVETHTPQTPHDIPQRTNTPADLIEIRLEQLAPRTIPEAIQRAPRPVLAACRRGQDGGLKELDEHQREERLNAALEHGIDLLDIEHDAPFTETLQHAAHHANTPLIKSHHDTEGTPTVDALLDKLKSMQPGADIVKLATRPHDDEDVHTLLETAKQAPTLGTPFTLMGLGDSLLRGLAGPLGMALVYTTPHEAPPAPGQLPTRTQHALPRYPTQPQGHHDYVLLGHPIKHSLSPRMQNAAFHRLNEPARYRLVDVPPNKLDATLEGLRAMKTRGGNTTAPHKKRLYDACDEPTDTAQACQAVNTFRIHEDALQGHMTDGIGLVNALHAHQESIQGRDVLLIGAGGTAHAAAHALTQEGANLHIANRTSKKAKHLASAVGAEHTPLEPHTLEQAISEGALIINATPVDPPIPHAALERATAFDANYGRRATFAHRARTLNAPAIDGISLLIHQGIESLSYWLDEDVPIEIQRVMETNARTGALERRFSKEDA